MYSVKVKQKRHDHRSLPTVCPDRTFHFQSSVATSTKCAYGRSLSKNKYFLFLMRNEAQMFAPFPDSIVFIIIMLTLKLIQQNGIRWRLFVVMVEALIGLFQL